MKRIALKTTGRKLLADVHTPVGIYLRLRDRFRDTILLESTDHHSGRDSWSFICINAIGGIEISGPDSVETKFPGRKPERNGLGAGTDVPSLLWNYMRQFEIQASGMKEERFAQGLYGYTAYDAVRFFEPSAEHQAEIKNSKLTIQDPLPHVRYRLYQYVIAIDHFRDELFLLENQVPGVESEAEALLSLIRSRDLPVFPFRAVGEIRSNLTDEEYREMVHKGIASCHRGDVFQIVVSRSFQQSFAGDEFNVYRALRSVNPSPYLFFFDYGDYKLMGSSPEAQLLVRHGTATVHPIAGTFPRSGDDKADAESAQRLLEDAKENAEHVMLVDLARNDLSRHCQDVKVSSYRQVQYFSHVIHLVSEVQGRVTEGANPFELLAATFPAGTLSGAPKIRAMQLIRSFEPTSRGYYGGAIGYMGFDGSCNHAILIRSFMSRNNTLTCQAGAGVVAASDPERELQEVNNKLGALRKAVLEAEKINS